MATEMAALGCSWMETPTLPTDSGRTDRRRTRRHHTLKGASIVFRNGYCSLSCQILDTSETGALLRVADFMTCPNNFVLKPRFDPHHDCEVVWRKGEVLGVRYL
jgi:hypothetical protein